jgi:hypothetical protein
MTMLEDSKWIQEIRCQFHQRYSHAFFVQIFGAKLCFILAPKIRTKKHEQKTLMKLTAGINFNISLEGETC